MKAIRTTCIIGCIFFFISVQLNAQTIPQRPNKTDQQGLRQGEWTILYDANWNIITEVANAEYYRLITYQDDKPVGKVYDYFKHGIVHIEMTLLADRPEDVVDGLVVFYDAQGKKESEETYEKGKLVNKKSFLDPNSWKALIQSGEQLHYAGEYQKAIDFYKQAVVQAEKEFGKNHRNYAYSCNNLAEVYRVLGRYAEAEPRYIEAKKVIKQISGTENPDYASSCNNLALMYQALARYAEAEPLYMEAKMIREKVLGKDHPSTAVSLNNLAGLYRLQGRYAEAEPLYVEARSIWGSELGKEHPYYATACNNLGLLYQLQGRYKDAEKLYLETKKLDEKISGKEHPNYASSCNNLAELYTLLERYDEAEPLYVLAKNIHEKKFGKEHPTYATSCNNLAELYTLLKHYDKAESLFVEARGIDEAIYGKDHPYYAISCHNLAKVYAFQGQYRESMPYIKQASQTLIQQTDRNFATLSEKEKGAFFKTFKSYFEVYNSLGSNMYQQQPSIASLMYDNALMVKGLLLNSSKKIRERILGSNDETLKKKFEQWQQKKDELAQLYTLRKAQLQAKGIDKNQLEVEVNTLEKELSLQSQGFADITEKIRYSWTNIQQKLKRKEAAVEIIRTRYFDTQWTDSVLYIALIVKPDTQGQPELVVLPNGNALESKYLSYYQNHIKGADKYSYTQFWQPIAEKLRGTRKVYFSPDGVFHQINLNTLQNPENGKFLLREMDIHLLGSTKYLVKNRKPSSIPQRESILLGRPTYGLDAKKHQEVVNSNAVTLRGEEEDFYTTGEEIADLRFSDLPGTEAETRQIYALLKSKGQKVSLYLHEEALEEVIKGAQSPKILHMATHGFFFENTRKVINSDSSQVYREAGDLDFDIASLTPQKNSPQRIKQAKTDPMLRSGIVFTGVSTYANSPEKYLAEDGFLTAYEAQNLNLDNTDLVVLSACETGKGDIHYGEGVYGLQRGFQQAGAKAVLMSLWKVDDSATQELMTAFYAQWLSGKSMRKAFQRAQHQLKQKYKHPYYWGAFVLVGE